MDPTIIAGGLKLLGGLFGSKKKSMSPQQSIMSTAAGARQAAKKYGFNALTLLAGSNATAGAGMDMGTPPLASLSVLGDLVEDQFGDDAKTRREHNQLQNELLRLEVDRARSIAPVKVGYPAFGGSYGPQSADPSQGHRGAVRRDVRSRDAGGISPVGLTPLSDTDIVDPRREVVNEDQRTHSGFVVIDSPWGGKIRVPSLDGDEALDVFDAPSVIFALPQLAWNLGGKAGDWLRDSPSSPIRRTDTKEYKEAPYGRDAYGRPLPKPEF